MPWLIVPAGTAAGTSSNADGGIDAGIDGGIDGGIDVDIDRVVDGATETGTVGSVEMSVAVLAGSESHDATAANATRTASTGLKPLMRRGDRVIEASMVDIVDHGGVDWVKAARETLIEWSLSPSEGLRRG